MIKERGNQIIVTSQFNINGSRGKDAGAFVSDYVSRESATSPSTSYVPPVNKRAEQGDGVAFTLSASHLSRQEVLDTATRVQELHETGTRAIQQMVISFTHDYLVNQRIVAPDTKIVKKGDYEGTYDDVRLRHAVRSGLQSMIDDEGYRDGKMIACIQHDTRHLHVHVVAYEDADEIARKRGKEEKGVIKASSLNRLTHDIDRYLSLTKTPHRVPNAKVLTKQDTVRKEVSEKPTVAISEPVYINPYLRILEERKREAVLKQAQKEETIQNKRDTARIDKEGNIWIDKPVVTEPEEPLRPKGDPEQDNGLSL